MACGSTSSMTCFEDLSNELIYEIFDHLDFYHINESFSNLNSRFNNLINSPICPIKVNLSSISKSTFEHYYTHIIIPYQNRITLFQLSNCFIADIHPIPYNNMLQLQTLILQDIESKQLEDILTDLSGLPSLSSLILKPIDTVYHINSLYRLIFRLPILKYCAVTTNGHISSEPLPFATCGDFSPIETFLINSSCYIDELNALLSYVPHIRYLSCDIKFNEPILIRPLELNNLRRLRLKMKHLPFDQIVLLLKSLFNHLQIFYIITDYSSSYIDPNQWEQIRFSLLSNLIFFRVKLLSNPPTYLFWFNRQWHCQEFGSFPHSFYSIESIKPICSYRNISSIMNTNNLYSVNHISIRNEVETSCNLIYFPYVTTLTISLHSNRTYHSLSTVFDRIISLTQLTKLIIDHPKFCVGKLVELLYYSPNIRNLTLHSISFHKISTTVIQESETFEAVSKKSRIRNVTILNYDALYDLKFLVNLCPRLEQLSITVKSGLSFDNDKSIIKILLEDTNNKPRHLFFLCCRHARIHRHLWWYSRDLPTDVSRKLIGENAYYWW